MSDSFRAEVETLPEQFLAEPRPEGGELPLVDRLVIAGMGGSAMAGEFLAAHPGAPPGVRVVRAERLPGDLREGDALLAVSYSGRTRETLALWDEARERGLERGAVASGGELWSRAEAQACPRARVPSGLAPRSSLGHLLRGASAIANTGAQPDWEALARHVAGVRERWGGAPGGESRGARLASRLAGRLPVLLAPTPLMTVAARRWSADLSENAKCPSWVWEFPEAAHNAVMALAADAPRTVPMAALALGCPPAPGERRRWRTLLEVLADHGAPVQEVAEPHEAPWIEALGIAHAGDWVSLHLAEATGLDAGGLSLIDDLKRRLAGGAEDEPLP